MQAILSIPRSARGKVTGELAEAWGWDDLYAAPSWPRIRGVPGSRLRFIIGGFELRAWWYYAVPFTWPRLYLAVWWGVWSFLHRALNEVLYLHHRSWRRRYRRCAQRREGIEPAWARVWAGIPTRIMFGRYR